MNRLVRTVGLWVALVFSCSVGAARPVLAQSGALFLLVPFGARAVSLGEAVSADTALGVEGVWWNAASLARIPQREVAFHHSQTVIANSEMLTVVVPSRIIGTIAASAYIVDYGDQQATDSLTGAGIGTITNRNYLLAISYATPVGKRLGVGVTYKWAALRFACSGSCGNVKVVSGATSAVDVGAQYALPTALPLSVGFSVRNLGPKLQVKDQPQADALPRVIQFGLSSRVPMASLAAAGAALDVSGDVLSSAALGGTNVGIGAALSYREQYFLRAGYKVQQGDAGGPSLGFGLQRGAFAFDFSRRFDRLSSLSGQAPTYFTMRARF